MCLRHAPYRTRPPRVSANDDKSTSIGGYSISIGGAQAVPKLSAMPRSAAAWCTPMAMLCWVNGRVSFSVFSWVFVFVKAYFYVSTSTMVSQCVLRLNCKTPAGLTRYGYCVQHAWLWRSSALVPSNGHRATIAYGSSTNAQVVCSCHTSHQRKAQATSLSCELSQNIASLRPFSPTRTSAACSSLAPLFFRELYTGIFVVYSAIIFCSFLALYCM